MAVTRSAAVLVLCLASTGQHLINARRTADNKNIDPPSLSLVNHKALERPIGSSSLAEVSMEFGAAEVRFVHRVGDFEVNLHGWALWAVIAADLALICLVGKCCSRLGYARGTVDHVHKVDPKQAFDLDPPIFMLPKADMDGDNGIIEVCFGEVEGGCEVTVIFKDEDRLSKCEDLIYDNIRRPLFGRYEDIETFTILKGKDGSYDQIKFEGTYSGDQAWDCKFPAHDNATLPISDFQKDGDRLVIWVNVWNHLFGPKNNNPDMEMFKEVSYKCSRGTRKDCDDRFCGLITKIA